MHAHPEQPQYLYIHTLRERPQYLYIGIYIAKLWGECMVSVKHVKAGVVYQRLPLQTED